MGTARSVLIGLASLIGLAIAIAGCADQSRAIITVAPRTSMNDVPVHIVVTGAGARRRVVIALRSVDSQGVTWSSRAVFRSTRAGTVDVATRPSIGGSYQGVDPMGLIDALGPTDEGSAAYQWGDAQPQSFALRVSEAGQTIATDRFFRRATAPNVMVTDETRAGAGFDGQFWRPAPSPQIRPAIVVFGGSEGGLDGQLLSGDLASAGYPTLDLAYFRAPGLPEHLQDIPLGYFARALRWVARQPGVQARRIYVAGASRGSEAAQLLAIHYPGLVFGVIASTPSDIAFGAVTARFTTSPPPAWTYRGRPVPYSRVFLPYQPVADPAAEIPLQHFHGPVLLDCGTADQVWSSCAYATAIERRLSAARDPFSHVLDRFVGGGHFLNGLVPYEPFVPDPQLNGDGDTFHSNQDADARLWPDLLSFLADPHGPSGTTTAPASPPTLN